MKNSGVWFRDKGQWVTEASSLIDTRNLKGCPCPSCGTRSVTQVSLTPVRDREGEITDWKGSCSCGAKLSIFND